MSGGSVVPLRCRIGGTSERICRLTGGVSTTRRVRGNLTPHCAGGLTESWWGIYMDTARIPLLRSTGLSAVGNLSHLGKRVRGVKNNKNWFHPLSFCVYIYFTYFHSLSPFFEFTLYKRILYHKRLALLLGLLVGK